MKYNLKYKFSVVLVVGMLTLPVLSVWAGHRKTIPSTGTPVAELSPNDQKEFNYFFIEASRQQNAGNYTSAFNLLQHALRLNPFGAEAYYFRAMYFSQLKNDSLTLVNLEKAATLNPDNSTYLERVAQYYIGAQDYAKAIEKYEELSKMDSENIDYLKILIQLYNQQKNYDKMIATINRLEIVQGSSEDITLSKVKVYEMKNDKKAAYNELKSLVDKHPFDNNYKVMFANWLMQNNRLSEAYKLFTCVLNEEPNNAYALSSMYDYYKAINEDTLANKLMVRLLENPKTDNNTKLNFLKQAIQQSEQVDGDSLYILGLFDKALSSPQINGDIAELRAAYMSLKKMPADSLDNALKKVLSIAPDNTGARIQLIQSYWAKKNFEKVIDLSKVGTEYHPDEMAFYYFEGLAYYQQDKHDEALDAFRRGVTEINPQSNSNIVSDFYAIMGDILHQKGMTKEAFAAYDSCLQWKEDNVECLNNYAYYLSEEDLSLPKAEQMSYRTIKAEPKNSTFLDTYAWILFKQNRYAEAKIYIDQALKNDTDTTASADILKHAGDIYALNNLNDKAVVYWQKAMNAGCTDKILPKKIKLKKYIKERK